ncbi:MAG: CRISPR-associated protein Cas5 [Calditrichaeota bacterium]|nr:CRISPR-associated protein Cas5 [Calditrichota bacterium]
MQLLVFDLKGSLAHFRRPDTMGTQATYPFITRTALQGLIASVLGVDRLPEEARCGLRLLSPVRTVAQELSMHGKSWVSGGDEKSYRRPTAIELVVKPRYRVYYTGAFVEELKALLQDSRSHYHTYLGSAFCLTFPRWVKAVAEPQEVEPDPSREMVCVTVVPSPAVARLLPEVGRQYARVGGILKDYLGNRCFRGSVAVIYEVDGGPLRFKPKASTAEAFWRFYAVPDEGIVCLW